MTSARSDLYLSERYGARCREAIYGSLSQEIYDRNLTTVEDITRDVSQNNLLLSEARDAAAMALPSELALMIMEYYTILPNVVDVTASVTFALGYHPFVNKVDLAGVDTIKEIDLCWRLYSQEELDFACTDKDLELAWHIDGWDPAPKQGSAPALARDLWAALILGDTELLLLSLKSALTVHHGKLGALWDKHYLPLAMRKLDAFRRDFANAGRKVEIVELDELDEWDA